MPKETCKHPGRPMDGKPMCADCPRRLKAAPRPAAAAGGTGGKEQDDKLSAEEAQQRLAARLNQSVRLIRRHVWATPAQTDTMALVAAVTNVTDEFVTLPRVLWQADQENVGKTRAMKVTLALSWKPVNTAGTFPDTKAKIFQAAGQGLPCPTLYRDEASQVFGLAGANGEGHPLADILRRGYVTGEMIGRSTSRASDEASIFSVFMMTARKVGLPKDIRTRTIVIKMEPAQGRVDYFDERDQRGEAADLAYALRQAVLACREPIGAFRVRRLRYPGLTDRKAEVWESLFAVANAAGQEWLNRCMAAFTEIALDDTNQIVLSPEEAMLRDMATALGSLTEEDVIEQAGRRFVPGRALRDELRRLHPADYAEVDDSPLGRRMQDAMPMPAEQIRVGDSTVRGYFADDIALAWDVIKPRPLADVEVFEDDDPWADVA